MTFSPPCISLLLNPPCVARQLRRYTGFPPSSVCSYTRSCVHRKAFAVRILEQFVSTSLFGMLLILFHNGFHPKAILVRLHPKAILGSELGEGGACALPSHCQRLVSMLCDIFFIPFPFNSSSFEMVFGQKKVEEMSEGQYVAFEVSDPWCGGSVLAADLLKT